MYRPDVDIGDHERLLLIEAFAGNSYGCLVEVRQRLAVLCVLALFNAVLLSLLVVF
jgi:hypothetical protein